MKLHTICLQIVTPSWQIYKKFYKLLTLSGYNGSTRTMRGICSKSAIKTLERQHWRGSGVFFINYENVSQIFLMVPLLNLNEKLLEKIKFPCRSAISIKLQSNFIETTFRHGYSPVNLLHIFGTTFSKNTHGLRFLKFCVFSTNNHTFCDINITNM